MPVRAGSQGKEKTAVKVAAGSSCPQRRFFHSLPSSPTGYFKLEIRQRDQAAARRPSSQPMRSPAIEWARSGVCHRCFFTHPRFLVSLPSVCAASLAALSGYYVHTRRTFTAISDRQCTKFNRRRVKEQIVLDHLKAMVLILKI